MVFVLFLASSCQRHADLIQPCLSQRLYFKKAAMLLSKVNGHLFKPSGTTDSLVCLRFNPLTIENVNQQRKVLFHRRINSLWPCDEYTVMAMNESLQKSTLGLDNNTEQTTAASYHPVQMVGKLFFLSHTLTQQY